jgi:hypothetical protein
LYKSSKIQPTMQATTTQTAKRVLSFDLVDNEVFHARTTGYRAPDACWAPQRPVYAAPNNYTATTGFVAPSLCHAPQRRTESTPAVDSSSDASSDASSDEETGDQPNLYSATTGYRPANMCWAPKRV